MQSIGIRFLGASCCLSGVWMLVVAAVSPLVVADCTLTYHTPAHCVPAHVVPYDHGVSAGCALNSYYFGFVTICEESYLNSCNQYAAGFGIPVPGSCQFQVYNGSQVPTCTNGAGETLLELRYYKPKCTVDAGQCQCKAMPLPDLWSEAVVCDCTDQWNGP